MKTFLLLQVAILTALSTALHAAPRVVCSTASFAPESEVDVIFEHPVVAPDALGKPVPITHVQISPPIPGTMTWMSPVMARLKFDAPPQLGATHVFSVPEGLAHLDGTAIPAGRIGSLNTEPFMIRSTNIRDRWDSDFTITEPAFLAIFNDAVDPAAAARHLAFRNGNGETIAANVRHATVNEAGYQGRNSRSWPERAMADDQIPTLAADAALPISLIVTPVRPLTVGPKWALVFGQGLPNQSGTAMLPEGRGFSIGDIEAFTIGGISANISPNEPRNISISFNHRVPSALPADFLTRVVTIDPRPENLTAEVHGNLIILKGDFQTADSYSVEVSPPFRSKSGFELVAGKAESITFERCTPNVTLPSTDEAQLAEGVRTYDIHTVNIKTLKVRAKRVTGSNLVRTFQGYRQYTGSGPDFTSLRHTAPLPFEMIVGETVIDVEIPLDNPIDTSKQVTLDWSTLLPEALRNTALFLDVVGVPHEVANTEGRANCQAIIQLTDIGLAWKISERESLVYAFSCMTGEPLANVSLAVYGEDAKRLAAATTDANGLATLPRGGDARHIHAMLGRDNYVTAWDRRTSTVGMWHFPVRTSWLPVQEKTRRVFMFTDRPIYRPGETLRLKGIVRSQEGNDIRAHIPAEARLAIVDPADREIFTAPVTISDTGSFDFTHALPAGRLGEYQIRLEFPEELAAAEARSEAEEDSWWETEPIIQQARFNHAFRVEEFRRNAFEVTSTAQAPAPAASKAVFDLKADYYQGTPVAAGAVNAVTRVTEANIYPERFRDFQFGNHRSDDWNYWYRYFGFRDDEATRAEAEQNVIEMALSPQGTATVEIDVPASDTPVTREITLSATITDANNQAITTRTSATVHPADVYVGVSRVDHLVRVGQPLDLKLVAVTPSGEPFGGDVKATATLVREVNQTTKTENENGERATNNDASNVDVLTRELAILSAESAGQGHALSINPENAGTHFLTVSGTDAAGRAFSTTVRFHVYGEREYPWAYEEGIRIKMVPEKKQYRPGDTARVLVLSPIEGTALVTLERDKVVRSFRTEITLENPVIEIPLDDESAPNVYASILIVRGSAASEREHPAPQLRLGYCELTVENVRDRLAVAIEHDTATTHRPGDEVTLTGTVRLADGTPAAGAEVAFFAEDEGTLSVMGFDTPDPMALFYDPRLLSTEAGTSFEDFLPENPEERYFHNKGFFIGGGADLGDLADRMRENFDPCATWAPALVTDASGRFTHTFTLPDTLTRYRLMAIAQHGVSRFGHSEAGLVVNKDIMIEPMVPRFANQGDSITPQVLVQNASTQAGTWRITGAVETTTGTPPVRLSGEPEHLITLAAGASATVAFPALAETTGEATLVWAATPVSLQNGELTPVLARSLSDSVKTQFTVNFPMPTLRQNIVVRLDAGQSTDLRALLNDSLGDATGNLEIDGAISPLLQAADSIDFLLQYPHGCLEQTTSGMIPWIAASQLRGIVPALAKHTEADIQRTIAKAVERILSMQLENGSFGYWPGSTDTVDWATSYAALGLALAQRSGTIVPSEPVNALHTHLITSLRGLGEEGVQLNLESHARVLLALAIAGNPQPAYHNLMLDRAGRLNSNARAMLASAIAVGGGNLDDARALMRGRPAQAEQSDIYWMPYQGDHAFTLLAWTFIDAKAPETMQALDRLLNDRNPFGHWSTTWVNSWALIAMGEYANATRTTEMPSTQLVLTGGAADESIALNRENPSAKRALALHPALNLTLAAGSAPVYLRIAVEGKPPIRPVQPVANNGLSVERIYERVLADGTSEILDQPRVGDLIRVSLKFTLPTDDTRYLVVEDLLPTLFEPVHSDFESQRAIVGGGTSENDWRVSHRELRTDRACFYLDWLPRAGTYTLNYLVRCTLPGEALAPPAKVESMYNPDNFALSASREFSAAK
jgi:uncharacterized protein YfaS (alpha-2-macroglobulin family)